MLQSLGWTGIVATGALLAGAGSWGLRGMGPLQRVVGCAVLAAVASLGWFTVVQPLMVRSSPETAALGMSLSLNVGLLGWVGSGVGHHKVRATRTSGSQQPVESP